MKRKYRVILALLLLITMFISLFPVNERLNAANENSNSKAAVKVLGPGKYFYLNPKWGDAGDWRVDYAKIFIWYQTKTSNVWKPLEMEAYGDLMRVKLPEDVADMSTGEFKLVRCKGTVNVDNGDDIWGAGNKWGEIPTSGNGNLKWSDCPNGSNTFNLTSYETGTWATDVWNGTNYAGKTIYFINMDKSETLSGLKAKFSVNGTDEIILNMTLENADLSLYSVRIPEGEEYDTVAFLNSTDKELGSMVILDGDYDPDSKNTYYYNRTLKDDGGIVNELGEYPTGSDTITGKKLYLDDMSFPVSDTDYIYIQVGESSETPVRKDSADSDIYSYTIPYSTSANQQTVITVRVRDTKYRFFWNDLSKDMIVLNSGTADVSDKYFTVSEGKRLIYFDATLSKLSYQGDDGISESFAIPESGKSVWCKAWKSTNISDYCYTELTLLRPKEQNGNIYNDIWRAEVPEEYDRIKFFSNNTDSDSIDNRKQTEEYVIPTADKYKNPCFYADGGDRHVYDNTKRKGYWSELYSIRDVESGKGATVVDIPNSQKFTHQRLAYYVPVTLYDYYTDYELNGNNRDNYPFTSTGMSGQYNEHKIYQPFRQFNMALSDYYSKAATETQLYWGNFQHTSYTVDGKWFEGIARTVNLYGFDSNTNSDTFKKFFYQNNSMWARYPNGNILLSDGNNATVNLVSGNLSEGNLMMQTNNGTVEAPFFNKEFIQGKNSKNAVLGKVYEDVKFPFIQKKQGGLTDLNGNPAAGTVDYWYFNSGDSAADNSNLRLKQDSESGEYYLEKGDNVKGTTTDKITDNNNYFPFNDAAQSGNAGKLNYGFGQKMEFNFKLTSDGSVETTEDVKVPIEFTFSGDDDVWIFVDGHLVLDVGGGHGAVTGKINFAKKESTVSGVKQVNGSGADKNVTQGFPAELVNDADFYNKEHTLTMYYMERGLWESNLHITFNFPDESIFSVEKEVDTDTVNNIFKDVYKEAEFPFNIKNQATHYGAMAVGGSSGFGVSQADIPGYGSVDSGKLENAAGADYKIKGSDDTLKVNDEGVFTLKDGQRADFVNQFRRGSYIYLNEDISQDNFNTRWELYDNDSEEKVVSTVVPNGHVNAINGKTLSEEDMKGTLVSDGRQEVYISDPEIANAGYTGTGPAILDDKTTDDTIVFRSYSEPDSIIGLRLRVKEINKVRTGSLTITKTQEASSADLGETEFEFKVTFTNVSDMNFEKDSPIVETVKLKKGASHTITGIPAGTEYKIEEVAKEGYSLKEVKPTEGNDTDVKVTNGIVTGKIVADDDPDNLNPTSFEYVNVKNMGSIDIIKKDSGGTISGVEFTLYESDNQTIAKDADGKEIKAVTDSTGKISFSNISLGTADTPKTYYLKETKTVKGYALMKEPIEVKLPFKYNAGDIVNGVEVTEAGITNHLTYTIINDKVFALPSSGEKGIGLYIMFGVILTVTAAGGLLIRARQKGKQ